ncbi:MAG: tetratricopeptide repeat protein [Dissulfurispiraceae bacterium]
MSVKGYIERLQERLYQKAGSRLFVSLAEEYRKQGLTDEAFAVMIDGIRRDPDFFPARLTLSRWYLQRDMLREAKEILLDVNTPLSDNVQFHKRLAQTYRGLGDEAAALTKYKRVLETDPFDDEALLFLESLGCSRYREESDFAGENALANKSMVAPGPHDFQVHQNVAQLQDAETLAVKGHYKKALDIYDKLVPSDSAIWRILQRRAELMALVDQAEKKKQKVIDRLNSLSDMIKNHFADTSGK